MTLNYVAAYGKIKLVLYDDEKIVIRLEKSKRYISQMKIIFW